MSGSSGYQNRHLFYHQQHSSEPENWNRGTENPIPSPSVIKPSEPLQSSPSDHGPKTRDTDRLESTGIPRLLKRPKAPERKLSHSQGAVSRRSTKIKNNINKPPLPTGSDNKPPHPTGSNHAIFLKDISSS